MKRVLLILPDGVTVLAMVLLILVAPITGCVTTNFTQPVASFQKSVNTSSTAIGGYFANLNEFERQLYLDDLAFDPTKKLGVTDSEGKPTPLIGEFFQASSIKARMDSLTLLGVYAQRLTDLAGSNAPQQFSNNAKALGESLTTLDNTFSKLTNSDTAAAAYIGPVSALIGSVGKMYLEQERDKAIREAVNNGAPAVRKILDLLEHDLVEIIKPLQTTGLLQELAERVKYYNEHRQDGGMNVLGRTELLNDIRDRATAYEASLAFNPTGLIQSVRQANEALVKYANAPRMPENFNELVAALQAFDQNAQEVATEIELIRQIPKGR